MRNDGITVGGEKAVLWNDRARSPLSCSLPAGDLRPPETIRLSMRICSEYPLKVKLQCHLHLPR